MAGADLAWYHRGRFSFTRFEGFGVDIWMLYSLANFSIILRSSGRVEPFALVVQVWMISIILDSGSLSMLRYEGMSVAMRASAKYIHVALLSPMFRYAFSHVRPCEVYGFVLGFNVYHFLPSFFVWCVHLVLVHGIVGLVVPHEFSDLFV